MLIKSDDILLFTGDSITDCGRDRLIPLPDEPPRASCPSLGQGYARLVAERLSARFSSPQFRVVNRGISGDRIYNIEDRLEPDLLALKPTVVSILAGINDTWRRYDSGVVSEVEEFRACYRRVLERIRTELNARIVIVEPFLLPVPEDRRAWREDLDPKIAAIRDLAAEYADVYVPLDGTFAAACCEAPAAHWLPDGVHPSAAGHGLIADAWLEAVRRA